MKSFLFFPITAALWAQSATPPAPVPAPAPQAQAPDTPTATFDLGKHFATVPPDTVIATYDDGQKLTIGELTSFLAAMPPNMAQAARRDRKAFVQQFAMMHRLSEMAVKAKLDEQSPTKEALAFNRMYLLMNAQLHDVLTTMKVPPADGESFYNANKERFKQVKVKAIYIAFSVDPSKPGANEPRRLTEAEALAKIAGLKTAIAGGASFVKLVKENSEDATSAAKDGDFGTLRSTDNLPDPIRTAVFALKAGEVSDPVKQPNGFYLFRAEEIAPQPYAEVQEQILNELKQARFKQWMDEITASLHLKIENEAFFNQGGPALAPGK
jgi:peptidyl-prolyl cis-trans isomerase C